MEYDEFFIQCKKEKSKVKNFRNRLRPIFSNNEQLEEHICFLENATFDMVWMNYFLNSPATMPLELDVLAIKQEENQIWAIAFETKNRNEKNLPTIDECKIFMNKLDIIQESLNRQTNDGIWYIF